MIGMKGWVFILLLLCLMSTALGARVHGGIYDRNHDALSRTIVYINSSPIQTHISKYGGYSFIVPEGYYNITANYTLNNITKTIAHKSVHISGDGDYRIDLIVYPSINITQGFEPAPVQDVDTRYYWMFGAIIFILSVALILLFVRLKKTPHVEQEPESTDPLQKRILSIIQSHGGSMPQKAIRKEVRFSQAKVSMVLSTMQQEGLIERIKKGRINIIRLRDN